MEANRGLWGLRHTYFVSEYSAVCLRIHSHSYHRNLPLRVFPVPFEGMQDFFKTLKIHMIHVIVLFESFSSKRECKRNFLRHLKNTKPPFWSNAALIFPGLCTFVPHMDECFHHVHHPKWRRFRRGSPWSMGQMVQERVSSQQRLFDLHDFMLTPVDWTP